MSEVESERTYSETMIITYTCVLIISLAVRGEPSQQCSDVLRSCQSSQQENVPKCLEHKMKNCTQKGRYLGHDLHFQAADESSATQVKTKDEHVINIPLEAVNSIRKKHPSSSTDYVNLIISVLNNTYFRAPLDNRSVHDKVLGVWLGGEDIQNLSNPVRIMFKSKNETGTGTCVYWKLSDNNGKGGWDTDGCTTKQNSTYFVCSCTHLSFFAVLISPDTVQDPADVLRLEHITYIGSSCSVVLTASIIVMFLIRRKKKTEHSLVIHVKLTTSLLLLHFFFLISTFWSKANNDAFCQCLGIALHWALLATLTWTAIEGFHLYLLILRVFNIYIRKYLLKLSLFGWGVPTIAVVICGVSGKYGKIDNNLLLCWVNPQTLRYITVNGYLGLVMLFNATILALVVVKIQKLKMRSVQGQNRVNNMWKDWASLLGLSCVLGIPWGIAFATHGPLSLLGTYLFTILNSFQGLFIFLWFLSVTCKSIHEEESSSKDLSMTYLSS